MKKKEVKIKRHVQNRDKSVTLVTYLAGLKNVELNSVMIAGEDLENNVMNIRITDLPSWIKQKANFKLKMSDEDIKLLKDYFSGL